MEERIDQIGLKKEDTIERKKWRNGVYELTRNISVIWAPADLKKSRSLALSLLHIYRVSIMSGRI